MFAFLSSLVRLPVRYLRAVLTILTSPKLLMLCLVPFLIGTVAFAVLIGVLVDYRSELASLLIGVQAAWLQTLLSWLIFCLSVVLAGLLSVLAIFIFGSFFIESFIEEVFKRRGVLIPTSENLISLIRSTLRGLRDDCLRLLCLAVCTVLLFIFGAIPILCLIPPVLAAFLAGYNMIDLPLALLQVRFGERCRIARGHWGEVLALGLIFLIFLLIPFGGILFMPVAYFVGVEMLVEWGVRSVAVAGNRELYSSP